MGGERGNTLPAAALSPTPSSDRPVQGLRVPKVHNPFAPVKLCIYWSTAPKGCLALLCDISKLRLGSGTGKPASTGVSQSPRETTVGGVSVQETRHIRPMTAL